MFNTIKQALSSVFFNLPTVPPETILRGWGLTVKITGPKPPYKMVWASEGCPTFSIISTDEVESETYVADALLCLLQEKGYVSDAVSRGRVVPELTDEGLYLNALPHSGTNSRLLMAYTK